MKNRVNEIQQIFRKEYKQDCDFVSRAPGRINLIGEHTDYNGGLVMPAAIDKTVDIAFAPSGDLTCQFVATNLNDSYSINLEKIHKTNKHWVNYLLGILKAFNKRTNPGMGFFCVIHSDIPLGAGMSSSAALECAFLNGLNHMYKSGFDRWELIDIIQESAHYFLGIKSGILDQFASFFGQKENAMMLNCGTRKFEYIRVSMKNYSFILVDTKVKHTHLTSAYNDRVEECHSALNEIHSRFQYIQNLSDPKLKTGMLADLHLTVNELKRAKFIINENLRVVDFKQALETGNIDKLGEILYNSHMGLKKEYEVSCDELDFLVDQTYEMSFVRGARMMGGGFGGCTLNLVHKDHVQQFTQRITSKYMDGFGINPDVYSVNVSDGAMIIHD